MDKSFPPAKCPQCGTLVMPPKTFGLWDGYKEDGTKVGGPVLKRSCRHCGAKLVASPDALDDIFEWKILSN
jgi:hypothetical protein